MYKLEELKPLIEKSIKNSLSMREAASKTKLNFKTFAKYAKLLNLYSPNPSGKGIKKPNPNKIPIQDILNGNHPQYHVYKLGKRLIKENIKEHICEICLNKYWLDRLIPLEVHHIDGNSYNHKLENLQLLCPNCHSTTNNYRGKNKNKVE